MSLCMHVLGWMHTALARSKVLMGLRGANAHGHAAGAQGSGQAHSYSCRQTDHSLRMKVRKSCQLTQVWLPGRGAVPWGVGQTTPNLQS